MTDLPIGSAVTLASTLPQIAEVRLTVTSVTGTASVTLLSRTFVKDQLEVTAPGEYYLAADVRTDIQLTLTGTATVTAEYTSKPAYCSAEDVTAYAVAGRAIEELSLRERCRARLSASAAVDAALCAAYTAPILGWGVDVRVAAAKLAAAQMFTVRGSDMQGADTVVFDAAKAATAWLAAVTNGRITPTDIVDSTPETVEFGLAVSAGSGTRRGW